jgi:flagellar hook-associated protein FlgK
MDKAQEFIAAFEKLATALRDMRNDRSADIRALMHQYGVNTAMSEIATVIDQIRAA